MAASWRAITAEDWKRRSVYVRHTLAPASKQFASATDLEVLRDFTNETLEGELPDKELGGLLVAPDFTEGDRAGPEAMGLLDTSGSSLNVNKAQQPPEKRPQHR